MQYFHLFYINNVRLIIGDSSFNRQPAVSFGMTTCFCIDRKRERRRFAEANRLRSLFQLIFAKPVIPSGPPPGGEAKNYSHELTSNLFLCFQN